MRCRSCGRQIPGDALLCPYCGQGVFASLPAPAGDVRRSKARGGLAVALAYLFFACSVCCLVAALAANLYYLSPSGGVRTWLRERLSRGVGIERPTLPARPSGSSERFFLTCEPSLAVQVQPERGCGGKRLLTPVAFDWAQCGLDTREYADYRRTIMT